ncbi:MAG: hypothetical protein ACP5G3_03570 [Sulfurihydrogenibium sp.]|uniref:hypothetical protein n=1 Tax=Sulfurihydrogenibium sp. TaxID=2053621 RepID=UPI003D14CA1C
MKEVLEVFEKYVKFIQADKEVFYTDIGYGEKFVTISLSVFDQESLIFYSSLQALKEIIKRFLNIKTPKGFRTRVFIYRREKFENFINAYQSINLQNIIYNINLDYAGTGSNTIGIYKMEEEDIKKVIKSIEITDTSISLINIKEPLTPNLKSLVFLKDENNLLIEKLDKNYYDSYLINKSVVFLTNFLNKVI